MAPSRWNDVEEGKYRIQCRCGYGKDAMRRNGEFYSAASDISLSMKFSWCEHEALMRCWRGSHCDDVLFLPLIQGF